MIELGTLDPDSGQALSAELSIVADSDSTLLARVANVFSSLGIDLNFLTYRSESQVSFIMLRLNHISPRSLDQARRKIYQLTQVSEVDIASARLSD